MEHNICHFIPHNKDAHPLHTINFVLETKPQTYQGLKSDSVYKMYYVFQGSGRLHTLGKVSPLSIGDIFFTFPAAPFAIESSDNLNYMYISFIGVRGNCILENLGIGKDCFLFSDCSQVQPFWLQGVQADQKVIALMSESVLLYTFAYLGNRLLQKNRVPKQIQSIERIKLYIDEHYTEHNFSLEQISEHLSYNKKYISSVFKKHIGVSVIEYLNTIRIQNACTMMEQGFTSINDIAERCGYGDPQYFSRVFRTRVGISPSQYIKGTP